MLKSNLYKFLPFGYLVFNINSSILIIFSGFPEEFCYIYINASH